VKKILLAVIVGAAVAGCGGADPQSMASERQAASANAATTCDTGDVWWGGAVISGNLVVPAGATCRIAWGEVKGNVSVHGNLQAIAMTFDRNVGVDGGSLAGINWGNTFLGNVSITNSPGSTVPGGSNLNGFWSSYSETTIAGNFSYVDNAVPLYMQELPTTVKGNFTYSGSPCGSTPTVLGATSISCY
jgi:hypothetical protein